MPAKKATNCKTCNRVVHAEHVDEGGNCCFCEAPAPPPRPSRQRDKDSEGRSEG